MGGLFRALRVAAAGLIVGGFAWFALDRWVQHEYAVERRALDARANELTQRALAAGSPLACLDAVANPALEAACEKVLYASPETTSASIAYVDAKLRLLADGMAYAARDPAYAPTLERLRRGLEADRYGMVAQALASRGCTPDACPALRLLHDPERVVSNMRERTFDANVVLHAGVWWPEATALAAVPPAERTPPPAGTTATAPSRFEFPSAASIPAVSIMNAEPPLSKQEEAAIGPPVAAAPPATAPGTRPQPQSQRPTANVPLPQPAPPQTR